MAYSSCYSGNYRSHCSGDACHAPVTSPSALCAPEASCEDAPCSPSSSHGSNRLCSSCQEASDKPTSCQLTSYQSGTRSAAGCSPVASAVVRSEESSSLPTTSHESSSCRPSFCRQPLSGLSRSYQYYGCQPLSHLTCGYQPTSYLPYGRHLVSYLPYHRQPLSDLPYGCQPSSYLSDCYGPVNYTYSNFQPCSSFLSGWWNRSER